MIKVICIEGKPKHPKALPIPEGIELLAYQSPYFNDCYKVIGYEYGIDGTPLNHRKKRFLPLSDIDETKHVNNKQEEYA